MQPHRGSISRGEETTNQTNLTNQETRRTMHLGNHECTIVVGSLKRMNHVIPGDPQRDLARTKRICGDH
jgi:hypothetical protein